MFFHGTLYITDPSYLRMCDDWGEIDEDMVVSEYSQFLVKYTGIGDGNWKVYLQNEGDLLTIKRVRKKIETRDFTGFKAIGDYCVDSGHVCLVYKEEADADYPGFIDEFKERQFCYAVIEDFSGEVEVFRDNNDEIHFIGKGNKVFFTA